jgi:tetratricopeptide (TPR) repeat protein
MIAAFQNSYWRWIGACVLLFALLMYPIVRRTTHRTVTPPATAALPDLLTLSHQYYEAGRYKEAVAVSRALLELNPKSADAYNNLGASYGGLGQWVQAMGSLQVALRINPDYQLAKNNLAWVTAEMQKVSPSEKTAAYYLNQSGVEFRANKFTEALASARECLRLRPDDADAYNNMAVSYIGPGQYNDAVESAENAVRLRSGFTLAQNNLAWALAEQQKTLAAGAHSR